MKNEPLSVKLGMLAIIAVALALLAGWVNNVLWTFSQTQSESFLLGLMSVFAAPVGAMHGIWLWF